MLLFFAFVVVGVRREKKRMSGYGYVTREEKKVYERSRRAAVMQDVREHRLLVKWLSRVQPDTLALFHAFKEGLQRQYPARKDLVRAPAFVRFMSEEGVVSVPRMTVPLTDIFQQNEQTIRPKVAESTVTPIQEPKADLDVPLSVNPFGLLDDEIDELLKELEAVNYQEIADINMDSELSAVLNMDVSDFVV